MLLILFALSILQFPPFTSQLLLFLAPGFFSLTFIHFSLWRQGRCSQSRHLDVFYSVKMHSLIFDWLLLSRYYSLGCHRDCGKRDVQTKKTFKSELKYLILMKRQSLQVLKSNLYITILQNKRKHVKKHITKNI